MSQPLVFHRPTNSYQSSSFMSNHFIPNHNNWNKSNDINEINNNQTITPFPSEPPLKRMKYDPNININNNKNNNTLHKPIKPRRTHRKRKLEQTDICEQEQQTNKYLPFIKPSNKRRRTNEMNKSNKQSIILQPELEANIYTNPLQINKNNIINNEERKDNNDNRICAPYNHLIHPYLRNKNKNNILKRSDKEEASDSDIQRDESPEQMFSQLNLNSFKMKNKQNESVNDWKRSIQLQLNNARNKPSNVQQLCQRINNTNGLGKHILLAKLRKELPNHKFIQICNTLKINPNNR